jgi:hypothetical protein
MTVQRLLLLVLAALMLGGCTALGVTGGAVAAVALGATGDVVRAGTEYRLGGVAYRTFTRPMDSLYEVTRGTLSRMAFTLEREEETPEGREIVARGIERTVEIRLQPISPGVTRLRLVVKQGFFRRDRATASEILTQIDLGLRAAPELHD